MYVSSVQAEEHGVQTYVASEVAGLRLPVCHLPERNHKDFKFITNILYDFINK